MNEGLHTVCVPVSFFPLVLKAQIQELLPLWSNQQNVDLTAQENPMTWAGASPSFPHASFPSLAGVWPAELNLFFLPSSRLKSPEEEFCQVACSSQREKGLFEFGTARAARRGSAGPSFSACHCLCRLFVLYGPSFKILSRTLSAWGYPM